MPAHTRGTMNGSMTRKPSSTSPASTATVMSRRSQGAETKSSIMLRSAQPGGLGREHGERQQHAGREGQIAAQAEPGWRQRRAEHAVLVQPEAAKSGGQH